MLIFHLEGGGEGVGVSGGAGGVEWGNGDRLGGRKSGLNQKSLNEIKRSSMYESNLSGSYQI